MHGFKIDRLINNVVSLCCQINDQKAIRLKLDLSSILHLLLLYRRYGIVNLLMVVVEDLALPLLPTNVYFKMNLDTIGEISVFLIVSLRSAQYLR